jgi:hypothetical protein
MATIAEVGKLALDLPETELRYFMTKAADKPESFSVRERDIRRANLRRFPYRFLFRVVGHEVREINAWEAS